NIEFIPAHVMTPQGIFGSKNPILSIRDYMGDAMDMFSIVETGLSADPDMLSDIPELDGVNFISNSDCHSPALNRIGREFTVVDTESADYVSILRSLKDQSKTFTYEFPPAEGKFFLTGHRKGKKGHEHSACVFSPDFTPQDGRCPICGKKLTIGVYEQLLAICRFQKDVKRKNGKRNNFRALVPLADVVMNALGNRTMTKKALQITSSLISIYGSEIDMWENFDSSDHIGTDVRILEAVEAVRGNRFSFYPGYDGEYGKLIIGEQIDYNDINEC
ncbi:MAG: hypothetical protein ACOCWO_04705, partial [Candidatus Muiribacteriaceae bacterium]